MNNTILIATACGCTEEGFATICGIIRESAETEMSLEVTSGIVITPGKGCNNLAFSVAGEEDAIEEFARQLTMVLMPARWSFTFDHPPEVDTYEI